MLEGKDSTWIDLSGEDKVSFFGLSSGQYKFRVREYMNRDSEDFVSFVVGTQRSWLLYVMVLGGVLAISAFVVYRTRNRKPVADVQVESPVQTLPPVQPSEPAPEAVQSSAESYSKLNEAEAQAVIEALKRYMEEQQPYLNVDLKQSDVAAAVGYPTYLLSAVFTHHLKMGYYDFVNSYRVERFKQSVAEGLHKNIRWSPWPRNVASSRKPPSFVPLRSSRVARRASISSSMVGSNIRLCLSSCF